nr:extracellular solute-binding protein [uncultured Clostridium sp.]
MRVKKMLAAGMAVTMAASVALSGCSSTGKSGTEATSAGTNTESGSSAGESKAENDIKKPEKITIMVNGTVTTKPNNRDAFEKRWEELTGIDLEIIQPDHDAYFDVLGQTFASGPENWPDAILLQGSFYTGYAEEGALWDMTEAWNNSELKSSGRFTGDAVVDNMKIDGKLYGFPVTRGNGCVTYVKKKWLDNVGLQAPTTYDEYLNMLKAFTEGDPDGNGVNGDTYGLSAAGFIGTEEPWTNYLPEFYQDAYPSFAKGEDGVWYDGFTKDNFKAALQRMRDAYAAGYIDKETLTNGTKDCRNKFYEDKFGVFTYWAGTWGTNLKNNLESNGHDSELIALKPIKEVGTYVERTSPVWAITSSCENPEGVFKYFIESMLDGGDLQMLWSYGVEDVHWSKKAETVLDKTYKEGEFHLRESLENPGTQYTKQHLDPMLAIAAWEGDPGKDAVKEEAKNSQTVFNENCRQASITPSTEEMATYNGDLMTLKKSIIADVVVQGTSVEEAFKRFESDGGAKWSQMIVDSLNKKESAK